MKWEGEYNLVRSTSSCPRARCYTCSILNSATSISGPKSNFVIRHNFTCTSSNSIFCNKCCQLYIGETDRFAKYLRSVRNNVGKPVLLVMFLVFKAWLIGLISHSVSLWQSIRRSKFTFTINLHLQSIYNQSRFTFTINLQVLILKTFYKIIKLFWAMMHDGDPK